VIINLISLLCVATVATLLPPIDRMYSPTLGASSQSQEATVSTADYEPPPPTLGALWSESAVVARAGIIGSTFRRQDMSAQDRSGCTPTREMSLPRLPRRSLIKCPMDSIHTGPGLARLRVSMSPPP
jgi:hypothetical protein